MDIELALINEHSKTTTMKIVKYIGNDKARFKILLAIFFNGEYRLSQRAAWPLSYVAINDPLLIKPHFTKLIHKLSRTDNHPAIARNILRTFQEIEIPEKYHAVLIDLCFKFIMDIQYPIAIRAFAITVAAKICKIYPELKRELIIILDEIKRYPQQAAITVRLRDAYKELK